MRYRYECEGCAETVIREQSMKDPVPERVAHGCGADLVRKWDPPQILCDGDPDEIPPHLAVSRGGRAVSSAEAARKEKAYQRDIQRKRAAQQKRNVKGWKLSNSIPAELYYGKVRQTGDRNYWRDPKNLRKHKSTRI
jgi:hypothetical protein